MTLRRVLVQAALAALSGCGVIDAVTSQRGASEGEGEVDGEGEGDSSGEREGEGEVIPNGCGGVLLEAVAIDVGFDRSCALDCSQRLVCWGANAEPVVGPGPFSDVAVSQNFACGLDANGVAVCNGQTAGLDQPTTSGAPVPMLSIEAGQDFLCGIGADFALYCWGDLNWPSFDLPQGLVSSLAVGWGYVCAHRLDTGALICGGTDFTPVPPAGVALTDVDVGSRFGCGLNDAGGIVCFDDEDDVVDAPIPVGAFSALSVGGGTGCAIKSGDASVVCFTETDEGATVVSDVPPGRFAQVSVADAHACAIRDDFAVLCWGDTTSGRTEVPAP